MMQSAKFVAQHEGQVLSTVMRRQAGLDHPIGLRGLALFCVTLMGATIPTWSSAEEKLEPLPILRVETGRHAGPVRRLSISEARGLVVTASDDKTARVWDLRTGRAGLILRPPIGPGELGRLYGAAIHPSLALVAVGGTTAGNGRRGSIYFFDLESGRLVRAIDAGVGDIKRLSWSADGTVLLAGYAEAGALRAFSLDGHPLFEEATTGSVYGLAIGPRGQVAATDSAGRVLLLRAAQGAVRRLASLDVQHREPWGVALSPDERFLVVSYRQPLTEPEVIEVATGRLVRRLRPRGATDGHFGVVSWSSDGHTIAVGGSAQTSTHRFPVWLFGTDDGGMREAVDAAGNSVNDLAPYSDGRFVFSSFDGSWGVIGSKVELRVTAAINDLRGAGNLVASGDARRVGWAFAFGAEPASFDLTTRVIQGPLSELKPALTRRSPLDSTLQAGFDAQGLARDRLTAQVNGTTVRFGDVELASCGTYLRGSRDAILGTTKALYRIDGEGRRVWRLSTAGEVDAVVASDDGRLLVTAMSDGLIQWRRASDGVELLTLLPSRDGRWIIWTPEGYFDASPGADTLAGWVVTRGSNSAAEFYSLGRFRDAYHRPDVIDRVLDTLDARTALELSPASMRPALLAPGAGATLPTASVPAASLASAPPLPIAFPPVLLAVGARKFQPNGPSLQIPFALRTDGGSPPAEIELRVDGRPLAPSRIDLPARFDGKSQGFVRFEAWAGHSTVMLLARDSSGVSEPLSFEIDAPSSGMPNAAPPPVPPATLASTLPPRQPASAAIVPEATRPNGARPNLYVLAVGVSEYERPEYRLGLPAKDATDFARVMSTQRGHLYGEVFTRVLTNSRASRQAVVDGLRWLAEAVGPNDVGMLFLAGHGVNEYGGQYYFMSYDAQYERAQQTAVAEHEIRDALRQIRGRALFFVDTCFAGNVIGDPRTASRELSRLANNLASAENGVIVFASSSGRQESEEDASWGNGAFTKALVDGLQGRADLNNAGRITFKGLDFYVSEEVRRLTKGRQTPVTITPIGVPDFDVASKI